MREKIEKFLKFFSTITKEESDNIEAILKWDDETKAAFMFAKKIFEEKEEDMCAECDVKPDWPPKII